MAGNLLLAMAIAPAAAALISLILRSDRIAEFINLAASLIVLACAIALPIVLHGRVQSFWGGYIAVDGIGAWVILCSSIVYALSSIFSIGYMRSSQEAGRLPAFYALFAGFAFTMVIAPMMANVGLYWIAIELTTLVSTFLVAFEHAPESIEAAWKYIMIVSAGISLALLGTVLFYWAGSFVLGPTYAMTWSVLTSIAPKLSPALLGLAFLLMLIGYGTKVGLAPMHTWLPDAHSESPAPVSAMLSGALLNTAMLGVVRFLGIAHASRLGAMPNIALVALGLLSLVIGAFFIVRQSGIKRLMAYSSVEHMGVVALGFGFGGLLGTAGALYHMLNHSLNKSLMFFGAGGAMRSFGTIEIGGIRAFGDRFPRAGALWLAGAVAITGAPPFGLFLSEYTILRGGLARSFAWAVWPMVVLLIIIFIGFLNHFRSMYFDERADGAPAKPLSVWCVVPMALALVPLLVFGFWWPREMWAHFADIARVLWGAPV